MKKDSDDPAAWFAKADKDLTLAQRAMEPEPLPELACYHAQQCAEKYLKGYLKSKMIVFKWIHDLGYLVGVCATCDASFIDLNEDAVDLTRLAEPSRYPASVEPSVSLDDAREGLRIAGRIRSFVLSRMGS
jgi:HEPN domain-containing protein